MLKIPILFNPNRPNGFREEDFLGGLYLVMADILVRLRKNETLYLHYILGSSILPNSGRNWPSSF